MYTSLGDPNGGHGARDAQPESRFPWCCFGTEDAAVARPISTFLIPGNADLGLQTPAGTPPRQHPAALCSGVTATVPWRFLRSRLYVRFVRPKGSCPQEGLLPNRGAEQRPKALRLDELTRDPARDSSIGPPFHFSIRCT